jgi:hypothetical protein
MIDKKKQVDIKDPNQRKAKAPRVDPIPKVELPLPKAPLPKKPWEPSVDPAPKRPLRKVLINKKEKEKE